MVLDTSPTLVTPALGTPASGVLTNCTGVQYTGFKNRIINGAMVIDQRNAGAGVTVNTSPTFVTDRWNVYSDLANATASQNQATTPVGFSYVLKYLVGTGASPTSGQISRILQTIEGYNVADLMWGGANAVTVTLSFWVNCSVTGTHSGSLANYTANRSYPFTFTVSSANTWEYKSITIAGDQSGTWLNTNGIGLKVQFNTGTGSTYLGTTGAWAGANYFGATGSVQLAATTGATLYITGVQLEKGSTATSFDYRPYGTELALCQRYYIKYSGNAYRFYGGRTESTASFVWSCPLPVEMRTVPTVSAIDVTNILVNDGSVQVACTSISTAYSSIRQITQAFNCGTVTSLRYGFIVPNSATAGVEASAEL